MKKALPVPACLVVSACLLVTLFVAPALAQTTGNPPVIRSQPASPSVPIGTAATLDITVAEPDGLSFQWYWGATGDTSHPVAGATAASFRTPVLYANASYWAAVSSADASAHSTTASVTVVTGTGTGRPVWSGLGSRAYGALGDGYGEDPVLRPIHVTDGGVAVSAYGTRSLQLMADGSLWSAGGLLHQAPESDQILADPAPRLIATEVTAAFAGVYEAYYLKADGSLWQNRLGATIQLATDVVTCATGESHLLFIKGDGSLWAMGSNYRGQLGDGTTIDRAAPVKIAEGVAGVAAGTSHSLFVKSDGSLWAMGYNVTGQLGDGTIVDRHTPVLITAGVSSVTAGALHSLIVKTDGSLWASGYNVFGQLGDGTTIERRTPVLVTMDVARAEAGFWHSVFIKTDGSLWGMGNNASGELGDGSTLVRTSPYSMATDVISVAAGGAHTVFVKIDGSIWATGSNTAGELGNGECGVQVVLAPRPEDVTAIATTADFTLMLGRDGVLVAVGNGTFFENTYQSFPGMEESRVVATGVSSVALGDKHAAFVKADGTLWTMGQNDFGQLGGGGLSSHSEPIQVATGVASVAAGGLHTGYVTLDGDLWTFGANSYGQLGIGSTTISRVPVKVTSGVDHVAAGASHTVFRKTDGTVWTTGSNSSGQLADGTTENRAVPMQVATGIARVFAGGGATMLLTAGGELTAAGYNDTGLLGDGTFQSRSILVPVADGVAAVSCGFTHSAYVKVDGTAWGMGANSSGALGVLPIAGSFAEPIRLADGVTAVVAGGSRTFLFHEVQPPQLLAQPPDQRVEPGASAAFTVIVSSATSVSYQWRKDGVDLPGATQSSLTLTGIQSSDAGDYTIVVTNLAGSVESAASHLTVNTPPSVPAGLQAASIGERSATISWSPSVDTEGDAVSYGYALAVEGAEFPADAVTTVTTISVNGLNPDTRYSLRVRARDGHLTSDYATADGLFTTLAITEPPEITSALDLDGRFGESLAYQITATHSPDSFTASGLPAGLVLNPASGEITGTPTVGGTYAVVLSATNIAGTGSASMTLSIEWHPPVILTGPASQSVPVGSAATLGQSTADPNDLAYQWFAGESGDVSHPVSGAVGASFRTPILFADASYWVRISSAEGFVDSASARISVSWNSEGKVVAWNGLGRRDYGALGDGYGGSPALRPVRVGAGIKAVSAAAQRSLFLHDDGTVWNAGGNIVFSDERTRIVESPSPIQVADGVRKAIADGDVSYVIKEDGSLWVVRSGLSTSLVAEHVKDCVARGAVLFVTDTGELWGFGENSSGQLGDGTTIWRPDPVHIASGVASAATGGMHSLFVKTDGSLWAMGNNSRGQLGDGTTTERHVPVHVADGVVAAAAGGSFSLFVRTDGFLWGVGYNGNGQLGDGTHDDHMSPVVIDTGVAKVAAGGLHTLFLKQDRSLWGMGWNYYGALGDGTNLQDHIDPVHIAADVVDMAAGELHSLFLTSDGIAWAMGLNLYSQLGSGEAGMVATPQYDVRDVTQIVSFNDYTLMLARDGTLSAVGDGTRIEQATTSLSDPAQSRVVATGVVSATVGFGYAAFVKADGTLWTMGENFWGQLGDGTERARGHPSQVAVGVSSASAGGSHTAFVTLDDRLWAMGSNNTGQLGRDDLSEAYSPIEIMTGVAAVAAGQNHTVVLKRDGSAWAMGDNSLGQLADGTTVNRSQPTKIADNVSLVRTGFASTVFLRADGVLFGAGLNNYRELGETEDYRQPVPVALASNVIAAEVGWEATLFVTSDRRLWGLGANHYGQLGAGASFPFATSIPELIAEGVLGVSAGRDRTFFHQVVDAPRIYLHPESARLDQGSPLTFSVSAVSAPNESYQWRKNGVAIEGATSSALSISNVQPDDGGSYTVVVSNLAGSVESNEAVLVVNTAPSVPAGLAVVDVTESAATVSWEPASDAQGDAIAYEYSIQPQGGAWALNRSTADDSIVLDGLTPDTVYNFRVRASDGGLSSSFVIASGLIATLPLRAPVFVDQPASTTVLAGQGATFAAAATGTPSAITYQWQRLPAGSAEWINLTDGSGRSGATTRSLSLGETSLSMDGEHYRCVATNGTEPDAVSSPAMLQVTAVAVATPSPSVLAGGSLRLSSVISGVSAPTYRWQRFVPESTAPIGRDAVISAESGTWVDVEGATGPELDFGSVQRYHGGLYRVVIVTGGVEYVSAPITLTVEDGVPSDARLLNLSTRALCQTGDNVLIPGFYIDGAGTKRLLLRAVGPELTAFGVGGALSDPQMVLKRRSDNSVVATNDNWGDNANWEEIRDTARALYAFGLTNGSKSAALLLDLPAGGYTIVASGQGAETGVSIVELYDVSGATDAARLINISNRGFVGVGGQIMIPGFVVSEEGSRTFLIRAVGPTLSRFNVPGVLADPRIEVYKRRPGTDIDDLILTNDTWGENGDAEQVRQAAASLFAFRLNEGSADAAFVVTLPPGAYTVNAKGVGDTTGVALVEVYLVP